MFFKDFVGILYKCIFHYNKYLKKVLKKNINYI